MTRALSCGLVLFLGVFAAACGDDDENGRGVGDACASVDCSGHGTCVVDGTEAGCECDTDYHADGLACVADFPGSCSMEEEDAGLSACIDFSGSYYTATLAQAACATGFAGAPGTYSTEACDTSGRIAFCTVYGNTAQRVTVYFYRDDASTGRTICEESLGGVWETL